MSFDQATLRLSGPASGHRDVLNMGGSPAARKGPPWRDHRQIGRRFLHDRGSLPILSGETGKATHPIVMNAPSELNFEEMLRIRLGVLMREHR
ncbi:MAG: hypothetical protein V4516_14530, partial [Pseudomonadota bacterium]